jgi:hypothetical protein
MRFLQQFTRVHILAIGCVFFVAIAAIFYFSAIKPQLDTLGQERRRVEDNRLKAGRLESGLDQLAKAQEEFLKQRVAYDRLIARQPKIDTSDPIRAAFDFWREYGNDPNSFGNAMTRWMINMGQFPRGIQVPAPPLPPVAVPPLIAIPFSSFGMTAKSFPDALSFIRKVHEMPRVTMMGGSVTLRGASPNIGVEFPLTAFIITRNAVGGAPAQGPMQPAGPTMPLGVPALPGAAPSGRGGEYM